MLRTMLRQRDVEISQQRAQLNLALEAVAEGNRARLELESQLVKAVDKLHVVEDKRHPSKEPPTAPRTGTASAGIPSSYTVAESEAANEAERVAGGALVLESCAASPVVSDACPKSPGSEISKLERQMMRIAFQNEELERQIKAGDAKTGGATDRASGLSMALEAKFPVLARLSEELPSRTCSPRSQKNLDVALAAAAGRDQSAPQSVHSSPSQPLVGRSPRASPATPAEPQLLGRRSLARSQRFEPPPSKAATPGRQLGALSTPPSAAGATRSLSHSPAAKHRELLQGHNSGCLAPARSRSTGPARGFAEVGVPQLEAVTPMSTGTSRTARGSQGSDTVWRASLARMHSGPSVATTSATIPLIQPTAVHSPTSFAWGSAPPTRVDAPMSQVVYKPPQQQQVWRQQSPSPAAACGSPQLLAQVRATSPRFLSMNVQPAATRASLKQPQPVQAVQSGWSPTSGAHLAYAVTCSGAAPSSWAPALATNPNFFAVPSSPRPC